MKKQSRNGGQTKTSAGGLGFPLPLLRAQRENLKLEGWVLKKEDVFAPKGGGEG